MFHIINAFTSGWQGDGRGMGADERLKCTSEKGRDGQMARKG